MAGEISHFFFLRQGRRITGPFPPGKLADMEHSGLLTADVEWSTDKISWRPLTALPWKKSAGASPSPADSPAVAIPAGPVGNVSGKSESRTTPEGRSRNPAVQKADLISVSESAVGKGKNIPLKNAGGFDGVPESETEKRADGEFWGTTAALLWHPADVPAMLHARWGKTGALRAGLTLAGGAAGLLFFILYRCLPQFCKASISFPKALLAVCAPGIIFWIGCVLSRFFWGKKQSCGLAGDVLIAGGALWFAVITLAFLLTVAKLFPWSGPGSNSILFAGIALPVSIYGCCGFILSAFNGLTEVSGISRAAAGRLLTMICAGPFFLAYVLFRTFLIQ